MVSLDQMSTTNIVWNSTVFMLTLFAICSPKSGHLWKSWPLLGLTPQHLSLELDETRSGWHHYQLEFLNLPSKKMKKDQSCMHW